MSEKHSVYISDMACDDEVNEIDGEKIEIFTFVIKMSFLVYRWHLISARKCNGLRQTQMV
jgi:hypothetical protein